MNTREPVGEELCSDSRPLVVHVMYRFDVGGLENGIVNLINHMPRDAYRHAIVSLTEVTEFRQRIRRDDVQFVALEKPPGHALWIYPKIYRVFCQLRPAIVHTRNLGALEVVVPAWAAGAAIRIHGEHGRDVSDMDGTNRKYQWIRRLYRPFVTYYIALSRNLAHYLTHTIGIRQDCVEHIYNGVDTVRFQPSDTRQPIAGCPFNDQDHWLIGTVGRMQPIKDQPTLVRAFIRALEVAPELKASLRLVLVGDGPLKAQCETLLTEAGCREIAWLPGERGDVPDVLRGLDCFVLPSLSEGISNAILEAMASGLPVIATDVGGNGELVVAGETGELVPVSDVDAMAQSIVAYARDRGRAKQAGRAGRELAERRFSLTAMVQSYQSLYDRLLGSRRTEPGFAGERAPTARS